MDRLRLWWSELTPEAQAWLKGLAVAVGTALFNTMVAAHWIGWKGMLAVMASSSVTAFKLYKSQSPFPRRIFTEAERKALTGNAQGNGGQGNGGANANSAASGG